MAADLHGVDDAEKFLRALGLSTKTALSNTLNELSNQTEQAAAKSILAQLNLSKAYVNNKITVEKSSAKTLIAKVRTEKRGLSLARFNATQLYKKGRRSGVSVRVKRRAKKIPKAFMFKGKNNNKLMAIRQGKGKNNFKVLYGPSVSQVFNTFHDPLYEKIGDGFFNQFEKELVRVVNEQI